MTLYVHAPVGTTLVSGGSTRQLTPDQLTGPLSLSLLHQRFAGRRTDSGSGDSSRGSPLKDACDALVSVFASQRTHAEPLLKALHGRLDRSNGVPVDRLSATDDWDHAWRDVRLVTRLAIGLGNDHPFENGLTLHHTVGVPMIPGTTMKGLVRGWRNIVLEGEAHDRSTRELYGWESEDRKRLYAGQLYFLDALPLTWPRLTTEIINNHLPAYYQGRANPGAVPKESPVPVFLLVIEAGTMFRFRVGASKKLLDRASHVRQAMDELVDALSLVGVGARKANGFGIFED
ncbi:MAG: type III-B CRISPR module RAMP protein Cmr6 [Ardenticatenales bacterium]|nr:type III-B CRISPR module RAMP protein Cmr6 [Ardenticatenales bacterium]